MELDFEEIEVHFDDLQEARRLVSEYTKKKGELDDDIKDFSSVVNKTLRTFRRAVNHLDDENVEKCLEEYKKAFDGHDVANKFVMYWRNMLKTKVGHDAVFCTLGAKCIHRMQIWRISRSARV